MLEWNNPGCPFVKKHYGSGNMQKTQAAAAKDGVVWLTINSGAPGKQGHMNGAEAKALRRQRRRRSRPPICSIRAAWSARRYDAKTTPHMYIVNKAGKLVYAGGIDDKPTAEPGRHRRRAQPCAGGAGAR